MNRKLEFTDEELQVLDLAVNHMLANTRVELHHTQGFPYKDHVKERIRLFEQILAKFEATPAPAANQTAGKAQP